MTARAVRRILLGGVAILIVAAGGFALTSRVGAAPDLPTAAVAKGDFVDYVEVRGEIRPARSTILAAPMRAGDLQIVTLAKNGSAVKPGDVVVRFDTTALRQRLQEKQSELKEAEGEIEQVQAQQRITAEQDQTDVMRARYELDRARLDLGKREIVSRMEYEQAKLAVADAEQKLREVQAKAASDTTAAQADIVAKQRKRQKAQFDVDQAQHGLDALQLKAPTAGMVSIMPNYRSGSMFGADVEFREGDRVWSGAQIIELPDMSSMHLEAHLDESDRGRLKVGQTASVHIEAVPGRDFTASVDDISVLAKVDFSGGWPPLKNFDLAITIKDPDPRIRPGMSATARIAAERVPGMLLVPTEAVFQHDGHPVVFALDGSLFDERRIEVARRGRDQVAVAGGLSAGEKVATVRPDPSQMRGSR